MKEVYSQDVSAETVYWNQNGNLLFRIKCCFLLYTFNTDHIMFRGEVEKKKMRSALF